MSAGEYGKFDFSGVYIDINKNLTEYDVAASSLHEYTHRILSSSSSVGMLDFLLMNVYEAESGKKLCAKIQQLYDRVSKSSIKVQECTAMLTELLMLKIMDKKTYFSTLEMYDVGQKYMKEYGFEKLKFILSQVNFERLDDVDTQINNIRNIVENIRNIAIKSMNIDIYIIDPLDGKYMKCLESCKEKYNSNYRFMKVIKYIENDVLDLTTKLTENEINNLFHLNGLSVYAQFDWDEFNEWANNMLCKPLGIMPANKYITYIEKMSEDEQICAISAYNSSNVFKIKPLNYEEEVISSWTPNDILYIQAEETYYRYVLVNMDNRTQYIFHHKYVWLNLAKEVKLVFMDRNHYKSNIFKCPQLLQFDIFVDIGTVDCYAINFIREECLIDYYIQKVNANFSVIFFRGSFHTVFFLMYPLSNIRLFFNTNFPELIWQDSWWEDYIPEKKKDYFCEFLVISE